MSTKRWWPRAFPVLGVSGSSGPSNTTAGLAP